MSAKHLVARLLSGKNQLSRDEKDAIFARVMAEVAPRRPARRLSLWLALAGAAAMLVIVPIALRGGGDSAIDERFAARGDASASFALMCGGETAGTCRAGQTVLFDLQGATYRYFAAFARRDDGMVLWYVPDAPADRSADLRERLRGGVLDRGVVLDATHPPGRYQVYGIYSDAPLSRDEIKARFRPAAADLGPRPDGRTPRIGDTGGPGTAVAIRELVVR